MEQSHHQTTSIDPGDLVFLYQIMGESKICLVLSCREIKILKRTAETKVVKFSTLLALSGKDGTVRVLETGQINITLIAKRT